ncbi:hypothetical protein BE221DRAFT_158263 [Ostreococcus tauri]|uniref:CWF21 domain-containing protein n=1 Tax=Ostreococcus tauri TaxID=70448 RepID=A0A1Y5INF6_OSTTA|nr:hypothetical protein BE221DRAFT_158263 [Ostreococcus tauri]
MYNGIGLGSARGSGTSGYVQRNAFFRDASRLTRDDGGRRDDGRDGENARRASKRAPCAALARHEAMRAIEVRCAELEESLRASGASEETIEARVAATRAAGRDAAAARDAAANDRDAKAVTERKEREMEKLARAFGVDKAERDAREGDAFDQDLQRRLREEKREAREAEERRRERERRKSEKRAKKERKRAKKELKRREREERRERERVERDARRVEEDRRAAERAGAKARDLERELAMLDAEIARRGLKPLDVEERRVEVPPPPPGARVAAEVPPPPPGARLQMMEARIRYRYKCD